MHWVLVVLSLVCVVGQAWWAQRAHRRLVAQWNAVPGWFWKANLIFIGAVNIAVWIGLCAMLLVAASQLAGRRPKTAPPVRLPVVTVVAKLQLEMETSQRLHVYNNVVYELPDLRFNQRHTMVRLLGRDGLGSRRLGLTDWFEVDSAYYSVIHTDSTYFLSMWDDTSGYLVYHRAHYPIRLVRRLD